MAIPCSTCDLPVIERAFRASGRAGLMTVFRNDDRWDRSNVLFKDGRLLRYDKVNRTPEMRHIDYGLGVLTARALAPVPADRPFDLAAVYQRLLADDDLAGVETHGSLLRDRIAGRTRRDAGVPAPERRTEVDLMSYARQHLQEAARIIEGLDADAIERMAEALASVRSRGGRLFFLGVGGSAGNCSHAVNDFRKLAGFEAYAPTDNVSELTARTNDEGWDTVFAAWLAGSRLAPGRRRVRLVGRWRQPGEERQRQPGARAGSRAGRSARRSSASSAATAATRHALRTRA